jgi:hypothetical protein
MMNHIIYEEQSFDAILLMRERSIMPKRNLSRALLFFLVLLMAFPLWAQSALPLTETIELESADGSVLSVAYPDEWVAETTALNIFIGSESAAIEELKRGMIQSEGLVGVAVFLPEMMENLELGRTAPADDTFEAYVEAAGVEGDFQMLEGTSIPIAAGMIAPAEEPELQSFLVVLEFPDGTVIAGVQPGGEMNETALAILDSITFGETSETTPTTSGELETTVFDVQQPNGDFQLSIDIPEDWSWQYADGSTTIFVGSSQNALEQASSPDAEFEAGEVAISIGLPSVLEQMGESSMMNPAEAIEFFIERTNASGEVSEDDSFSVPAAHGDLTGANTASSGDIFALGFEGGTIMVAIQPPNSVDETILAILHSITFGEAGEATETTSGKTETRSFDVVQTMGTYTLSIDVPADWAEDYRLDTDTIYLGTSENALEQATVFNAEFGEGEVAITIGLPALIEEQGGSATLDPSDLINLLLENNNSSATLTEDDSFSVPASRTDIKTEDGEMLGEVYALGFEGGTLLIGIQPAGAVDDAMLEILHSIRFEGSAVAGEGDEIRQWAVSADGSSAYSETQWGFVQATGEPDVPTCGDDPHAWASSESDGRDYLIVEFAQPVIPTQINIHQSFNPGSIVMIDVGNTEDRDRVLPLDDSADLPGDTDCPGVFSFNVEGVDVPIDFVVIYVDQSITEDWNEIDAVELVGTLPE